MGIGYEIDIAGREGGISWRVGWVSGGTAAITGKKRRG